MITYHEIPIGEGGEIRCAACARTSFGTGGPYPLERVVQAISDAAHVDGSGRLEGVVFAGFEPFAHPRLPDLVDAARRLGVQRVCLRTDGGALSSGANAAGALAAGVTHLELVLLADGEEHDRLTGVPGLAHACEAGIRAFEEAAGRANRRVVLTGLVPMCRHNAVSAVRAVGRLASLGAVAIRVDTESLRSADRSGVLAVLDTAAVNGVHAWQSGPTTGIEGARRIAPWRTISGCVS